MNIIVCIKQVPGTQNVSVDPKTGVLLRDGIDTKMNPFDLYAIETAMKIKEQTNGKITVITMGPPSASVILHEAFSLGADEAYLITDRKFAGADVLATSLTLSQGIMAAGDFDLILCGKQTTDGDTSQVGPAIAEHLGIPHVSWAQELIHVNENSITVRQDLGNNLCESELSFPCLLTVEKDIFQPRLPSYLKKQESMNRKINTITLSELPNNDESNYGLAGSPTQVERIFEPSHNDEVVNFSGNATEVTNQLYEKLVDLKFVERKES